MGIMSDTTTPSPSSPPRPPPATLPNTQAESSADVQSLCPVDDEQILKDISEAGIFQVTRLFLLLFVIFDCYG
jgi:hypothetical protein